LGNAKDNENDGLFSILATPVLIIDVAAVFLFNMGWTYIYYLYDNFGVNVHALDIPVYYFFVYSLPVIYANKWCVSFLMLGFIALLIFAKLIIVRVRTRSAWLGGNKPIHMILTVCLLILLPLTHLWSQQAANDTAADMRSGNAKTIRFFFKPEMSNLYPQEFVDANNAEKLKLLIQTRDRFIVFYQPESDEKVLPLASTYVVFNSDIQLTSIQIENMRRKL
jgi:hypothetical protein